MAQRARQTMMLMPVASWIEAYVWRSVCQPASGAPISSKRGFSILPAQVVGLQRRVPLGREQELIGTGIESPAELGRKLGSERHATPAREAEQLVLVASLVQGSAVAVVATAARQVPRAFRHRSGVKRPDELRGRLGTVPSRRQSDHLLRCPTAPRPRIARRPYRKPRGCGRRDRRVRAGAARSGRSSARRLG